MLAHVEEDLGLGVGEIEGGGALPQELPERRAAEGVEEIEKPLGLVGPGTGDRGGHGPLIIYFLNT
jgi:hypothetical protein